MSAETVIANDGTLLDLASLPATLTWSGTLVQTISVQAYSAATKAIRTFTQTFGYTGENVTSISGWIGQ